MGHYFFDVIISSNINKDFLPKKLFKPDNENGNSYKFSGEQFKSTFLFHTS